MAHDKRNRYAGDCAACGCRVKAFEGYLTGRRGDWKTWCEGCVENGKADFSDGRKRGRCEDAPCCGCCGDSRGYVGDAMHYMMDGR